LRKATWRVQEASLLVCEAASGSSWQDTPARPAHNA